MHVKTKYYYVHTLSKQQPIRIHVNTQIILVKVLVTVLLKLTIIFNTGKEHLQMNPTIKAIVVA